MLAFAANSVLCRLALAESDADPGAFTIIRVLSGAIVLAGIQSWRTHSLGWKRGSWGSAAALAAYALCFSVAYRQLDAGTGALLLFAAVQATMITWGLMRGERPKPIAWIGIGIASGGAIGLLLPGATTPAPLGTLVMILAGLAWGAYSLRGRGAGDAIAATAGNFLRATLLVLPLSLLLLEYPPTSRGWLAALASGGITSGIGYVIWYSALPGLRATAASVVQLTVPVVATLGGLIVLGELPSLRTIAASSGILGGVALVFTARTTLDDAKTSAHSLRLVKSQHTSDIAEINNPDPPEQR